MDRRAFVATLAAAVASGIAACTRAPSTTAGSSSAPTSSPNATPAATTSAPPPKLFGPPTGIVTAPIPKGAVTGLPGEGNLIALTIDDGTDSSVVGAYAELCARTGLRATFFCNGVNPSWTDHKAALAPMVESGQILLCNHTWSHPDLRALSKGDLAWQVTHNEEFLLNSYGINGRPFMRPPFGYRNASVDAQLADLGYPAIAMWYGSLGDSSTRPPQDILDSAKEWFLPQHIVIGHANHPPVIEVMDALMALIVERNLTPVHLGDVFQG